MRDLDLVISTEVRGAGLPALLKMGRLKPC